MMLEFDIGNSRIKWRLSDGAVEVSRGACSHNDFANDSQSDSFIVPVGTNIHRICVCNVAGNEPIEAIQQWAAARFDVGLELAKVSDSAGGVRCGYREPDKLGVDRWLAVLAAWRQVGETCIVVDSGTALTIDVLMAADRESTNELSVEAEHLGGYIVPGLKLMPDSLYVRTSGVRFEQTMMTSLAPGTDTGAAVQRGCLAMVVALIERARSDVSLQDELAKEIPVVLTGGAAEQLARFIEGPLHCIPDLVLDGLASALLVKD